MRAKRAGECDGPAGLPEAARGGPGPTPWSPPAWSTPVRATRAVRRPQGTARGGRRRRAPEPAPPPTRRPPDGPQAPSASPNRAREHPQTAAGAGEGPGEEHRPPGPPALRRVTSAPPTPSESPSHRATRSAERRGHYSPPTRRRPNCCGRRVCNTREAAGPPSAPKMKNTPAHSRRANGWTRRRGESPPTGSRPWPSSPPPTPTESTPNL